MLTQTLLHLLITLLSSHHLAISQCIILNEEGSLAAQTRPP